MNEKLNKMIYFEKRLMANRKELLELMEECNLKEGQESELLTYKLESFQKELQYLERQTTMLMKEVAEQEVLREQEAEAKTQEPKVQEAKPQVEAEPKVGPVQETVKETTVKETWKPTDSVDKEPKPTATYTQKDLEKTIGKSLMGIFASVLIFISLILFATLLLPYFNDTAKMITTYVVSFAFLGVGVWKMKKDPDNKFFIALTGCGMGALYISLLLSNMYFKVLGDIPLYVLIAIWAIGISVFAKNRSKVFQVIGELGILISMIFGCALCADTSDADKFFVLTIYYLISSGAFYFLHYEKEFNRNLLHHICNTISIIALMTTCFEFGGDALYSKEVWAVLVIVLLSFAGALTHKQEEDGVGFGIMASVYLMITYYIIEGICANDNICGAIYYFAGILLLALLEWRKMERKEGKYIVQCVVTAMMIIGLACWYDMYSYGAVPMLILPLMIAGFFLKNPIWKLGSLVSMLVYLFMGEAVGEWGHLLLLLLASAAGFAMLYWKKEQYSTMYKCCLYILTLLILCTSFPNLVDLLSKEYVPELFWPFVVLVPFNIVMMKSIFATNPLTKEKDCMPLYNFVNALLMIVGLIAIGEKESGAYHFFFIAFTLATFLLNSKNLLEKRDNMLAGIYVGIKFTVFLLIVLSSFDSANYVMSIACLLLAIGSIIIGFAGDYKSIRIYGLVLSMISIFKLIMIDISYANTLGHALSFFISGVLCFVISLIYNFIDKKMQQRA